MSKRSLVGRVLDEVNQTHATRKELLVGLERLLSRSVITFFTSQKYPVIISDSDNDMIEGILQTVDRTRGVTLVLNSLGGSALAAEKIVTCFRTYCGGDFEVIVPRCAKSAATMICMGSKKILMSRTAELGPIDPQVLVQLDDGTRELRPAFHLIEGYRRLFQAAVTTEHRMEPYILQLQRYDDREIRMYEQMIELGEDIAVKALKAGMMANKDETEIRKSIAPFLDPAKSKTHGRPIYLKEAVAAGLSVEEIELDSELHQILWELYLRSDHFVASMAVKLVESVEDSYWVSAPREG